MRSVLYSGSGDVPRGAACAAGGVRDGAQNGGFLTRRSIRRAARLAHRSGYRLLRGEFARTGFRGGLNWYRNIDRNWELLAPFAGLRVMVPALYIAGDRDLVVAFPAWTS